MPPFVQTDNFLFSDEEEGADTVVFPKLAVEEPDVVPDSSDEASTGPPLEMELDGDSDRDGRDSFTDVIQGDVNGYAHLEARSRTEEAFKAKPIDLVFNPPTVDPRDLALRPKIANVNNTPQARDSEAGTSSQAHTSNATTEVLPSEREDTASQKTVSPGERPGMLGRSLLQGLRTESAAEAVKNRQRPKAKPLALASKAVRAAIRGPSPPRAVSKDSNSTKASTSALPDEEDEDDELRLKSKSTHTAKKSTRESSVTSRKSTGLVIEVDTDEEEDQPLNKPAKKAVGPKGPVSKSKGKGRQEVESESDSTSDFAGDDNEDLRAIGQIMAKESEEDSDYNGKGEAKDRWTKKSKKKKGQSKSSKSDPEEPVSRGANRLKKTKGQPSAVYPASKKDKSHTLKNYGVDSEDEEPVEVGTVRKTSRSSKKGTAKESKTRSPKGPQPRSKEFLDDEDMADDQVTTSWSQLHQSTTIVQPEKLAKSGPPSEASEGETEALASSSDAPVSKGRKVTKTYSRKTNNRTIAKVVDSDEDEVSDRARDIVENRRSSASTSCPPEEAKRKADDTTKPNDKTKINSKGRTKRSESPAYAVIIDNSAKKSKPPTSRDNGASTRTRAEAPPDPAPSTVAVSAIEQPLERDQQMTRPQGRKGLKPNIVESEEEVTESEEKQDSDSSAQPGQRASTKEEVNSTSNKPTEAGLSRLVLQSKDRNVTLPAQKMTTNDKGASTTPAPLSKTKSGSIDTKPVIGSTGKRFHDMVVAKGGGQGIKPQGLSKRSVIPSLLTFRGVPPPKKKPIPPAPVKKKKKGEEVYSDDDLEELNDQPEEWWEADDFYAWEQRKRKRAKAKGEIDSDEERELTEKGKKMKKEGSPVALENVAGEMEHFSD